VAKLKTFTVWATHEIFNNISIKAESLEDALAQSKDLKDSEFITVHGEYMYGTTTVTGVMED